MVAMVAFDGWTRIASSHRQPEAHEWIPYFIHVPPRPLAWNPRAPGWLPRAATVPLVQDPFAYEDLRACVHLQISDAAARANAGLWLGLGAHPSGLGVHNARNVPCHAARGLLLYNSRVTTI